MNAPIAAGVAGFVALVGAMFDAFAVGFAGTSTLQHLMEFYTQAIDATDATGIDQAATEFVDVLKSGTEFVAAVISLLTIGQSAWDEMEDVLQSLLGLFRAIGSNLARLLSFLKVFGRIGGVQAFTTALSSRRWQHLTDLAEYIDSRNNDLNALLDTLSNARKAVEGLIAAETPEAERLIDFLLDRIDDLGVSKIQSLMNYLDIRSLERIFEADGICGLDLVQEIINLESDKKVVGLNDWIEDTFIVSNISQQDIFRRLFELREAKRMSEDASPNAIVRIGNDLVEDRAVDSLPSLDNILESGGAILRLVEVKVVNNPVRAVNDFTYAIQDTARKIRGGGYTSSLSDREVSIYADFLVEEVVQGTVRIRRTATGRSQVFRVDTGEQVGQNNLVEGLVNNVNGQLSLDASVLTRINIYSKTDNEELAVLENQGGIWSILTQRDDSSSP